MAAVGRLPPLSYNTDPGVYEPECDFYGDDPGAPLDYPDTEALLYGYPADCGEPAQTEVTEQAPPPETEPVVDQALPLARDYVGLGGPKTIPLYTPSAFENPKQPMQVERTILDEIFLEPTGTQLTAFYRVMLKGQV